MVNTVVRARVLKREQISGLFNHHNSVLIPSGIGANLARTRLRQVPADFTVLDRLLHVFKRPRQRMRPLSGRFEHMKRQSLRRAPTNAGQTLQFVYQPLQRLGVRASVSGPGR